jgi:F-type H+-transporting ATPase subunit delta
MKGTRAAHRYAKAILAYAQENNSAAVVAQDMLLVTDLLNKSEALQTALDNPLLVVDKKRDAVHALFPKACDSTTKLFALLAENNRLSLLGVVATHYTKLYAEAQGEIVAVVTSAVPLTPELEKKVFEKAKAFSKHKIQIENKVDPKLLGGFILNIGDLQYDASVAHQLKAIKTRITKTNSI